ncbi:MAG: TIGR03936 family radical SAM-associated protein [Clostridia bacterium]|nr:TIGR03936 family radical SAM-associated protein [Clostridia bacterium]
MIAFKYTKTDGAEYLSHLDLLRHIDRTLKRAGIKVKTSEGFNPHPKIFMNSPLGLGIKSIAEYCAVDCFFSGDFKEAFNANSPCGVKCLDFKEVSNNPNYAYAIKSCQYSAEGLTSFDPNAILNKSNIAATDGRGREIDLRERICGLEFADGKLYFTLLCGEKNLRPDFFCEYLEGLFGGKAQNVIKLQAFGENVF